jgi:hypothetical protein
MDGFINWVKNDWQNRRVIFINEVIAFLTGLGAAVYQSIMLTSTNYFLLYTAYTVNAVCALIAALGRRSVPLMITNLGYILLDVYALSGLLLQQR